MIDEQIRDGDYVIVEDRRTADNGEMVIALLNGSDVTLKKLYREQGHIRLQPANPAMQPIIVYGTILIPQVILFEAALSFLGIGIEPGTPSWGSMISDAVGVFDIAWWFMTFPGLALLLTVLAFNLVGDGLQDALNPRTAK